MQGSDYFNLAQQSQKEGRWQDALTHLEEGDRKGCGMCMWWLAEVYREEYWGKRNDYFCQTSATLLQKAIDHGNARAAIQHGIYEIGVDHYVDGKIFLRVLNYDLAKTHFKECNDSFGERRLADCLVGEEVICQLLKTAELGNPLDQYILATRTNSIHWYKRAANQNHLQSQRFLYQYFMKEEHNYAAGRYWYNKLEHRVDIYIENQDRVFDGIGKCQKACRQLILIRKYRQTILNWIPKDVVLMIAKILWTTYEDVCWQERRSKRLRSKKKIKYTK